MIKYFRFIRVNDTVANNQKKVDEEWGEWQAARGTEEEPEELVDLIQSLCNLFDTQFGYQRLKIEDMKNIMDVKTRYEHLIPRLKRTSILSTSFTPDLDTGIPCLHLFSPETLICTKCGAKLEEVEDEK